MFKPFPNPPLPFFSGENFVLWLLTTYAVPGKEMFSQVRDNLSKSNAASGQEGIRPGPTR